MSKTVAIKQPTLISRPAEAWIDGAPAPRSSQGPTKRLTVDIPEPLHRRIKADCGRDGLLIADVVRELLAEKFPAGAAKTPAQDSEKPETTG